MLHHVFFGVFLFFFFFCSSEQNFSRKSVKPLKRISPAMTAATSTACYPACSVVWPRFPSSSFTRGKVFYTENTATVHDVRVPATSGFQCPLWDFSPIIKRLLQPHRCEPPIHILSRTGTTHALARAHEPQGPETVPRLQYTPLQLDRACLRHRATRPCASRRWTSPDQGTCSPKHHARSCYQTDTLDV